MKLAKAGETVWLGLPQAPELKQQLEQELASQGAAELQVEWFAAGVVPVEVQAAVFATALRARHVEFWSDAPAVFRADPALVPNARLIPELDYLEARELASTRAIALHPAALDPLQSSTIPLSFHAWTQAGAVGSAGTRVSSRPGRGAPRLKAISIKQGVVLFSVEGAAMWQRPGFLARIFAVFDAAGVSVDLVSTSEMSVSVTLDQGQVLEAEQLSALAGELGEWGVVRVRQDLGTVGLVGHGIRSIMHRLGPTLELFEEQHIHLVSQSSSDLNLSFVVDGEQVERLVRRLHAELFAAEDHSSDDEGAVELSTGSLAPGLAEDRRWWMANAAREQLLAIAEAGSPAYVYDRATLERSMGELRSMRSVDRVFYAIKANSNADILKMVGDSGLDFECVSPGEIARVFDAVGEAAQGRILFTPNFAPREDYVSAYEAGAIVTLDGLHPLLHWGEVFRGREIMVRIDTGLGRGHHEHVKTAGARSKFGLDPRELPRLQELADQLGTRIVGLHAHSGSGIRTVGAWRELAEDLAGYASALPEVRWLDVGGGLGVPEKPGEPRLNLAAVDAELAVFRQESTVGELWIEPGRYVVAEAGVLLARVTQVKRKSGVTWIGIDAGMHSLIRPALYGAWHEIVNLSRLDEPADQAVQIVGPICESGDVLGQGRFLPETREGDVLLIGTAGAYGYTMSSDYNLRGRPRELILG